MDINIIEALIKSHFCEAEPRVAEEKAADDADDIIGQYLASRYGPADPSSLESLRQSVESFSLR